MFIVITYVYLVQTTIMLVDKTISMNRIYHLLFLYQSCLLNVCSGKNCFKLKTKIRTVNNDINMVK